MTLDVVLQYHKNPTDSERRSCHGKIQMELYFKFKGVKFKLVGVPVDFNYRIPAIALTEGQANAAWDVGVQCSFLGAVIELCENGAVFQTYADYRCHRWYTTYAWSAERIS